MIGMPSIKRCGSKFEKAQASLLGRLLQGGRGGWSLGASGAVYACFAASAVLFPDRTAVLIFLPHVRPAHAPVQCTMSTWACARACTCRCPSTDQVVLAHPGSRLRCPIHSQHFNVRRASACSTLLVGERCGSVAMGPAALCTDSARWPAGQVPIAMSTLLPCTMALDALGAVLRWRMLDHLGHLGGALFGVAYAYFGIGLWERWRARRLRDS